MNYTLYCGPTQQSLRYYDDWPKLALSMNIGLHGLSDAADETRAPGSDGRGPMINSFQYNTPLTSTWPHLNSDAGLEEGGY